MVLHKLTNELYDPHGNVPQPLGSDTFFAVGLGGSISQGVNLQAVLDRTVTIFGGDVRFADEMRTKASIRLLMPGFDPFVKQKNIRERVPGTNGTITRPKGRWDIVVIVGGLVKAFIEEVAKTVQGGPLRFGPGGIETHHLYLTELVHVSPGSYQPILCIDIPEAIPAPVTLPMVGASEPFAEDVFMADESVVGMGDVAPAYFPAVQAPAPIPLITIAGAQIPPTYPPLPVLHGTQAPPPTPVDYFPSYALDLARIDAAIQDLLAAVHIVALDPERYLNTPDRHILYNLVEEVGRIDVNADTEDVFLTYLRPEYR